MTHALRQLGVIAVMIGTAGAAAAGPLTTWGVEFRDASGTLLFSESGLTANRFVIPGVIPKPHNPPMSSIVPPQEWLDHSGPGTPYGSEEYRVTVTDHYYLTLTDEQYDRTSHEFRFDRLVTQTYLFDPVTGTFPHWSEEDEAYPRIGLADWFSPHEGGQTSTRFRFGVVRDDVHVQLSPWGAPPVPEPGTLLMAGIGLASGGGLWLRRRLGCRPGAN